MKRPLYALQGLFFKRNWRFGTAVDPMLGIRATINEQEEFTMFHALIGKDGDEKQFSGMMSDRYGSAAIEDFVMTETEMSFTKTYLKRGDPIWYAFKEKKDGIWYGTWSGPSVGTGAAKCIVNETDESFLFPVKETRAIVT